MTTTTTRVLAAGLLSVGLLAGCSNDSDPGGPSSSPTSSTEPTSASPSESTSQTDTSPTQGEESTSPSPSSADPTSIYPHGTPHEELEEGRQDGTPPDHIVATDAYRDAEEVIRAYNRELPVKFTEPGVPAKARQYVTEDYQREQASSDVGFKDGGYLTQESKILSVEPYNWTTQGIDTVTLDVCERVETHLYEADGTEYDNLDRQGNPVDPVVQHIVRYHLDSHDQGRSWRINTLELPSESC